LLQNVKKMSLFWNCCTTMAQVNILQRKCCQMDCEVCDYTRNISSHFY